MTTIEYAGTSEQGHVRFRNEDCIGHAVPHDPALLQRKGFLFVIADGVGGSGAGDVASREAVESLKSHYYESGKRPDRALSEAFGRTNLDVYDLGMKAGRFKMETTLSALALAGGKIHIAHIGDSRVYRIRSGQIEQLTRDDSEVAELVRMQILSPENARHHHRRHVITRSVGSQPIIKPQLRSDPLEAGDTFLMCTDGVWEPLSDTEMAVLVTENPPQEACRLLVQAGLDRQATDNLSVQVVRVVTTEQENGGAGANGGLWRQVLARWAGGREKTAG